MATKNGDADDLIGGNPADDLLGGSPTGKKTAGKKSAAKKVSKTEPKAKAAVKPKAEPKAKAEPKPKKEAKPKAERKAGPVVRGAKGSGKFYIDAEEFAALQKKVSTVKKSSSTKELAERFEVPTWKARLAAAALAKAGKGSMTKQGSVLVYTP